MIVKAKIIDRKLIANDIWEVTLDINDETFYFNAGQYIWIITPKGRRAFSISSSSNDTKNVQIIFRSNPKSELKKYVLDVKNSEISIRGPHGSLRVPQNGEKSIFIVEGIGISPVLSIIRRMAEDNIINDVKLISVNHSEEDSIYVEEIERVLGSNFKNIIGKISKADILFDLESKYYIFGSQMTTDEVNKILIKAKIPSENIAFKDYYPGFFDLNLDKGDTSYFKIAVNNSLTHMIMTDTNGMIVYANAASEKNTGFTFAEMKGQTPRIWGGNMDREYYELLWKTIKIDQKTFRGEFRNQRKNGEEYIVLSMITPIKDKENCLVGFFGIEEDITIDKQNEAENRKLNDLLVSRELKMIDLKNENKELRLTISKQK